MDIKTKVELALKIASQLSGVCNTEQELTLLFDKVKQILKLGLPLSKS